MSGIAAVQGRIAALQSRIDTLAGASPSPGGAQAASSATVASSARFQAALDSAAGAQTALLGTSGAGASGPGTSGLLGAAGLGGPPTLTGAPAAGGAAGGAVVESAMKYLGVPYVWGGEDTSGMDCSGFVQRTFADLGVTLPRVARAQATVGTEVPSLAEARPGDLIVTRGGAHIAIYLGDNRIIHAPQPGEDVSIRELFETDADILTIRRVQPATQEAPMDIDRLAVELAAGGAR